jgi:sn-glycerol 3-phosphate transport system ATP-binding protein
MTRRYIAGVSTLADMVEELGASRLLHGRLAGMECVAAMPSAAAPAALGALPIRVPPESIHLFDAETGLRVR